MVSKLDESVGRVVQALNEKKILHNTIIVFMSDNGSPSFDSSGRNFGSANVVPNWGSNFPFRGVSIIPDYNWCRTHYVSIGFRLQYETADVYRFPLLFE